MAPTEPTTTDRRQPSRLRRWGDRAFSGRRPLAALLVGPMVLLASLPAQAKDLGELPFVTPPAAPGGPLELPLDPKDGPDIDLRFELREDRVRVLATPNLAFVDYVSELPREMEDQLAPAEAEGAQWVVEELIAEHLSVRVDGIERNFETVAFDIEYGDPTMIALYPRFGARANTKLRIELESPLEQVPTRLALTWDAFPPDLKLFRPEDAPPMAISAQLNDGLFDYPLQFTVEEPEYVWVGQLRDPGEALLPVPEAAPAKPIRVSAVFVGLFLLGLGLVAFARKAGARWILIGMACIALSTQLRHLALVATPFTRSPEPPSAEDAQAIFEPLHRNVYTAFAFDSESDIYDALAGSVAGDLLDTMYVQVFRSLKLPDEGHGLARVQAVRHASTELESAGVLPGTAHPSFTVRARWEVDGSITHFGHSHERTNEYDARFTVAQGSQNPSEWRLVGHELLESRVVETRKDGQRFAPGGESLGPDDVDAQTPYGDIPEGEL